MVVDADDRLGSFHDELILAAAHPEANRLRAAMNDPFAENAAATRRTMRQRRSLQSSLDDLEPGAVLDVNTPVDGSCLFHGLVRGGLVQGIPGSLHISDLRRIALALASPEQLAIDAASCRVTVEEYVVGMRGCDWGDGLMLVLLSEGVAARS